MIREATATAERRRGRLAAWGRRAGFLALMLLSLGALLLVALFAAALVAPRVLGYQTYVIYGSSMEPAIKIGSLVVARPVNAGDLEVGDIVVFKSPGNGVTLTHRIIEIQEEDGRRLFRTKGDASLGDDPTELELGDGAGRVVLDVPYLGYFVDFAKSPLGILLFLALPAAGLAALHFIGGNRPSTGKEATGQA